MTPLRSGTLLALTAQNRGGSSRHNSRRDPCGMKIVGSRRIGRLLDPPVRPPPRDSDPLACLLPDRPDGDLGVLTQLLDVPGDLGALSGGTLTLKVVGFSA
jgi:hypothetical protein